MTPHGAAIIDGSDWVCLENYDAVGRWRDRDHGLPILTTGMLPSGVAFKSLDDIEDTLMSHPELRPHSANAC